MTDPTKVQVWLEIDREQVADYELVLRGDPRFVELMAAIDKGVSKLDARERLAAIEAQLKALTSEANILRDRLNR